MLVASRFSALLDAQGLLLFREVALLAWLEAWMPEHGSLHALEAVTAGAWFVTSPCGLSAYLRAGSRCGVPPIGGRSVWQVIVVLGLGQ